jgi:hypothetical protein
VAAEDAQLAKTLADLRADLVRGRPRQLGPDEGYEAFQQHKLLSGAVLRAAKLDQTGSESETDAWVRFVTSHYPDGRNGKAEARLLFSDWRTSLLKKDTPGVGVSITHGLAQVHWRRNESGSLGLNLEDAWDDFEAAVDSFVESLRDSPRRDFVLSRWETQRWEVRRFRALADATVMDSALSASFSRSGTRVNFDAAPAVSAHRVDGPDRK